MVASNMHFGYQMLVGLHEIWHCYDTAKGFSEGRLSHLKNKMHVFLIFNNDSERNDYEFERSKTSEKTD